MLKSLKEMEKAIEMLQQETDASRKTKSSHLLKFQFRMALDKIENLEKTMKFLRSELEQIPEYKQKQILKSLSIYMDTFSMNDFVLLQGSDAKKKEGET